MANHRSHEIQRWNSMSAVDLNRRLGKMTVSEKLRTFMDVAYEVARGARRVPYASAHEGLILLGNAVARCQSLNLSALVLYGDRLRSFLSSGSVAPLTPGASPVQSPNFHEPPIYPITNASIFERTDRLVDDITSRYKAMDLPEAVRIFISCYEQTRFLNKVTQDFLFPEERRVLHALLARLQGDSTFSVEYENLLAWASKRTPSRLSDVRHIKFSKESK